MVHQESEARNQKVRSFAQGGTVLKDPDTPGTAAPSFSFPIPNLYME